MIISTKNIAEQVRIYGVSDDEFVAVCAALGEASTHAVLHDHTLLLPTSIDGLSWSAYQDLLTALGDHRLRHVYAEGRLQMSPRKDHDWVGRFLARIVQMLTYELERPIQCIGSTTITSDNLHRGFEPDEAFYLDNEPKVRGKMSFEPSVDPPPDLIIEVDVTSNSEDRLPSFAVMGIPEVWRHDGDQVLFYQLSSRGSYEVTSISRTFRFLHSTDVDRFVEMIAEQSENDVIREVCKFARQHKTTPPQ